ncbi:MAG: metalloregulator ArsR/SmtB family transcription factor [Nanoarchaeota archaeon]|nr:metalloregulator ArsR/SmtB family transcription factor [Nanoarchaeota archaeon]
MRNITHNKRAKNYHVFFSRLSNKLRIDIITSLREKEMSVNELVTKLKVEQSKLSHALGSLKLCNLVNCKILGKKRIYSLNKTTLIPILNILDKHESKNCEHCNFADDCKCV